MGALMGRALAGLILSSLVFGVAYAALEFAHALLNASNDAAVSFVMASFATSAFLAAFFAGTVLILIGRPLYLIVRDHVQWYVAGIVGLVVAFAMDFALTFAFFAAGPEGADVLAHLPGLLANSAQVGCVGAVAGWAYWLIARPDRNGSHTAAN